MGCPICLDVFGEDNERGTRPVALPCGHIFHKACSDGWMKACRLKDDPVGCPLCKKELGDQHALPLWPSDLHDLDFYLANRSRRMDIQREHDDGKPLPAAQALDRYMTRDAQANLLGKLLDFRQHINAYVMAINNVSMSTSFGDRVFRLFKDTTKNANANDDLTAAMTALTDATKLMDDAVAALERQRKEVEEKLRKANENMLKSETMRKSYQKHMEMKAHEEQRMHTEATRISTLRAHLKKELQDVERRKTAMEKEREAFVREAREKAADAMRARVESAHIVAQSRGDADSKVAELNKYVQDQERLRIAAEDRTRDAKQKSNWLADRNKTLSLKLDAARAEVKKLKAKLEQESEAADRVGVKNKGKGRADEASREQSEDEDSKIADQSASSSSSLDQERNSKELDELRRNLSQERHGDDKTFSAVVIEDDLNDELDDDDYPMPIFGRQTFADKQVFGGGGNGGVSLRHPNNRFALPDSIAHEDSMSRAREDDGDDSVEIVGVKRRRPNTRSSARGAGGSSAAEQPQSGMSSLLASNADLMHRLFTGAATWAAPAQRRR